MKYDELALGSIFILKPKKGEAPPVTVKTLAGAIILSSGHKGKRDSITGSAEVIEVDIETLPLPYLTGSYLPNLCIQANANALRNEVLEEENSRLYVEVSEGRIAQDSLSRLQFPDTSGQ